MIGNKVCPELHVSMFQNEKHIHQNMMQTLLQADKSKLPLYLIIPCCPAPAQLLLASLKFNPSTSPASSGLGYYILSGALLFGPCLSGPLSGNDYTETETDVKLLQQW